RQGDWGDNLQLWLEGENSSEFAVRADRDWKSSDHDVAEVHLDDFRGQDEAISLVGMVDWILVRCTDWTMIPLENLVAAAAGSGTRIAVAISQSVDLNGAAYALQHGADAILLPPDEELWRSAEEIAEERNFSSDVEAEAVESMLLATVTSVESGAVGERICVDLTERLSEGEGMLIGSSANALVLIHGETIPSEFVPSRPFRVNAGAVHAYCLMADGSTKYLSELSAGDQVAIANSTGQTRTAIIGRLKIERRPFLLIRFDCNNQSGQVLVQQAETVRFIGEDGNISVTSIQNGDRITVRLSSGMRHIGRELAGEMKEK
ncbi:MAG: 3-dehydroquinate synthase II, partial [Candidatus Thermoplasmatota archaeon]|nr:3-dehydroquinate synthase II [Candidatus Thermoplasmatota archaeon]